MYPSCSSHQTTYHPAPSVTHSLLRALLLFPSHGVSWVQPTSDDSGFEEFWKTYFSLSNNIRLETGYAHSSLKSGMGKTSALD